MPDGKEFGCDCSRSYERKGLEMKKIINPCMCDVYGGRARGFVKIEYNDGRLSLSGVIGPMRNGNVKGSCGQCTDEIRKGTPVEGWTSEMLNKLCDIWDRWHLNDMLPYCEHQKELGWDKLAGKYVTLYNYRLNHESIGKKKAAENAALAALREGRTFTPTEEQATYATMPYSITTHEELTGEAAERYEPNKPLYAGDKGPTETKMLGWLYPKEHPEGILGKACPVCGYKYGTSWKKEEVPKDVIEWLFSLPNRKVESAWV